MAAVLPILTAENHTSFLAAQSVVLVLYVASLSSPGPLAETLLAAKAEVDADKLKPSVQIAVCADPNLAAAATNSAELPQLSLHRRPFFINPPGSMDANIVQRLLVEPLDGLITPAELAAHLSSMSRPSPRPIESIDDLQSVIASSARVAILFAPSHMLPPTESRMRPPEHAAYLQQLAQHHELFAFASVASQLEVSSSERRRELSFAVAPLEMAAELAQITSETDAAVSALGVATPGAGAPALMVVEAADALLPEVGAAVTRYEGDLASAAAVGDWLGGQRLPLLAEIGPSNYKL